MQLIQKYNYAELKRQDGDSRLYLTPDGESLPSVTTVLNKTKDKSFLKQWRAKVGEAAAEKIISDAGKIGTALHLYIERLVNEEKYLDLTEIGIQAEKMAKKIIEEAGADITEVYGSEVHLYYVKRIEDIGDYTNATDLPYRFVPCMVSGLAFYLSQKYNPQLVQQNKMLYEDELNRALTEDGSSTSTFITPKAYYPNV